ncbi:hypothetical protein DMUE_3426 [Dictyocoela muelleri]|nr:hypothetical protein DMUE_3426 [Dictyocoela muelleri]
MFIIFFNEYYGIKRDAVREYVEKCEACNLASSFKTKGSFNYITVIKTHERLFMDIIDLKNMRLKMMILNIFYRVLTVIPNFHSVILCVKGMEKMKLINWMNCVLLRVNGTRYILITEKNFVI